MTQINTYLTFDGNAREAMTFYKNCLGADLDVRTFEGGECPGIPEEAKSRVMHARLTIGDAILMASDTMPGMPFQPGNNFSISLNCDSLEEVERLFNAFGENGQVTMPLQDTFWGARFGMLKDQFGIHWMFNYQLPAQQ